MRKISAMMNRFLMVLALGLGASFTAHAQNVSVQLPTFRQFGVSTTVSVPDRGGLLLGGISRSGLFSSSRGVPLLPGGNRTSGGYRSASQVSAHVWIHDFEAMDRAILAKGVVNAQNGFARGPNGQIVRSSIRATQITAPNRPKHLAIDSAGVTSVAEHRKRASDRSREALREAEAFLAKAERAEQAGKQGLARIYFQMAMRRSAEPQRQEIAARLFALETSSRTKSNTTRATASK